MKRFLATVLNVFALIQWAHAQPIDTYVNPGPYGNGASPLGPPQIDATNFVNNAPFYATNDFLAAAYSTSDTLNFSNRSVMLGSFGFRLDYCPASSGVHHMASSFNNANLVNETNCRVFGQISVSISATNIVNRGLIEAGPGGLLSLTGKNVDLSRGTLRVDGFSDTNIFFFGSNPAGLFDQAWGVSTNAFFSRAITSNNIANVTSLSSVTNLTNGTYTFGQQFLNFTNAAVFVFSNQLDPSNIFSSVVFLNNTNPLIATDVRFIGNFGFVSPVVQWSNTVANPFGQGFTTNLLYLEDDFAGSTNLRVAPHFPNTFSPNATYQPINYTISRAVNPFFFSGFSSLPTNNTVLTPANLPTSFANGSSAAYDTSLLPTSYELSQLSTGASVTNQTGRAEITADEVLTLNKARIDSLNYISLKGTNHFGGSTNAYITAPYSDINLGSTNGFLNVTNLLAPYLSRLVGEIKMWSGRWTNVDGNGVTNYYHVLMVDSHLDPVFPSKVNNLTLRSTNVIISDVYNVVNNLSIDAQSLTITTNSVVGVGGEINLLASSISFQNSLVNLQYFTNYGRLTALNTTFFGTPAPLKSFVNRGSIQTEGNSILSDNFENSGFIGNNSGPFELHSTNALMSNGFITSANQDVFIQTTNLTVMNHPLLSGRSITLMVSGQLTDGGVANFWSCQDGFNLLTTPTSGDLFNLTITNLVFTGADVANTWGALDKGPYPSSYTNSSSLGHVILDGGVGSVFTFTGASVSNAIYIDYLELRDNATNFRAALHVDTNITIYVAASSPISPEKLQDSFYPRIIWVTNYTGLNSTTNLTLRNGQTITVNSALVSATGVDSDGDGVPNSIDPYPFDGLQVTGSSTVTNNQQVVTISWFADSANWQYKVQYSSDFVNWNPLTTVTSGPVAGQQMSVQDTTATGVQRFYRVQTSSH